MMSKLKHILTGLLLLLLAARSGATTEQVMSSASGGNIQAWASGSIFGYSLMAEDQLRNYMMTTPNWACRFGIKQSRVNVVLRYDETKTTFFKNWDLTVTYDIKLYNATSNVPYATFTNETALISYTVGAGAYADKFVKTYENAYKAELVIKSVMYREQGFLPVSILPKGKGNDIFLDLQQETERFYNLFFVPGCGAPVTPTLTVVRQAPFDITQSTLPDIQLPIAWNYIEGAESYDVEWLFIDVGLTTSTGQGEDFGWDHAIDFRNATRINTKHQFYKIPLSYPKGYVVFRVRPVGTTHLPPFVDRTEGAWSAYSTNGILSGVIGAASSHYHIKFYGLDGSYNWQYTAAYAEEGKRKEIINYFDGSLHRRQTNTVLNTDNNAVVAETKYDFQGRGSVQMLPTPVSSTGLHYYSGFTNFSKQNFDVDANFPVATATVSSMHPTGAYYGNNPSATGQDALVPNAQGFPYVQTFYKKDGTGRVLAQSDAGPTHKLGSRHETKYYYGTPSGQEELDRLFGSEVGNVSHYKKNLTLDANGQTSVAYLDQEGRVIATALANPAVWLNTLPLDDKPAPVVFTSDLLTGKNNRVNDARVSKTTLLVDAPAKAYSFEYRLNLSQACDPPCPAVVFCPTCAFDLSLRITDENGVLVSASISTGAVTYPVPPAVGTSPSVSVTPGLAEISCRNITSATFTVNIVFPEIGAYVVEKNLKINAGQLDQYAEDYVPAFLRCDTPMVIPPVPCNDCDYLCRRQHTRYDAYGKIVYRNPPLNTVPVYTDLYGTEIPVSPGDTDFSLYKLTGEAQIETRMRSCNTIGDNPPGANDDCAMRKLAMARDLSPGGQYFDNAQEVVPACASTITCSGGTPGTAPDDWLITNLSPDEISAGSNPFWNNFRHYMLVRKLSHPPATPGLSWTWVRDNWNDGYADFLISFHPEYCAFDYYCNTGRILCDNPADQSKIVRLRDSKDFDRKFQSGPASAFYNPASADSRANNSFSGTASVASFADYVSDLGDIPGFGLPPSIKDPYLSNPDCPETCSNGSTYLPMDLMKGYLQKFFTAYDCPACYSGTTVVTSSCSACPAITMSIWYVLDDPHNIALNGEHAFAIAFPSNPALASITLDPLTVSLFRSYHGYGTTPGLLSTTSKFAIFKALYAGHKKMIYSAGLYVTGCRFVEPDPEEPSAANCCHSLPHAQIRVPQDPLVKQIISTCPPSLTNLNDPAFTASLLAHPTASECRSSCEGYADGWMNELLSNAALCSPSVTLSATDSATMRSYLIDICAGSCDASYPLGRSSGTLSVGPGLHAFTDVYNYYFNNPSVFPSYACSSVISDSRIVHPPQDYSQANCTCQGLRDLAFNNGISWSSPGAATALLGVMTGALGVSPSLVNASDVSAWMGTCNATTPNIAVLLDHGGHAIPEILLCPSEDAVTEPSDECEQNAADARYQTKVYQDAFFETLKDNYRSKYKTKCLDNVLSSESLKASYNLDEFAYTLYYYDQAGNLIKTVPPKGVVPLPVSATAGPPTSPNTKNVAINRANDAFPKIWPAHTFITNYKYNSLNASIRQTTPDGGRTLYWHDVLGRLVASQNAKQATSSQYSYTLYDKLSRIVEVGEFTNGTQLTDSIARDRSTSLSFASWLSAGMASRHQITRTWYDEMPATANLTARGQSLYNTGQLSNLRNRVASITYLDEPSLTSYPYDHALHYRYDMHGNVRTLFSENPNLLAANYDVTRTDYDYDLVSGKVNALHHNPGKLDEFHHRYYYDADNRVVCLYTSKDGMIWERDVKYFYYKHGPLLRSELGDRQVQASDYAYTINGWIKGVNSNLASSTYDIGKDAQNTSTNLNRYFGEDGYGYTLGYFGGDYVSKNPSASSFIAGMTSIGALLTSTATSAYLYNGNISHMATTMKAPTTYAPMPQLRGFLYDQLNRIRWSKTLTSMSGNNWTGSSYMGEHREEFHYDLNGNIKSLNRNGIGVSTLVMDAMTYNYSAGSNTLSSVSDGAPATNYTDDIDNQAANNYAYDPIGNLVKDAQQNISSITWNVYGKIKSISKPFASQSDLEFKYDALGNRVEKIVKPRNASGVLTGANVSTHYVRDAQGNVLAVYQNNMSIFTLREQHLYGSSRLGLLDGLSNRLDISTAIIEQSTFNGSAGAWTATGSGASLGLLSDGTARIQNNSINTGIEKTVTTTARLSYQLSFEASVAGVPANNVCVQVVDVSSGLVLNPPIPIVDGYNTVFFTAMGTSVKLRFINTTGAGSSCSFVLDNTYVRQRNTTRALGNKQYELTNHLGNVLSVVSDRRIQETGTDANMNGLADYYSPQILSATDYYAFGAPMPGRNVNNVYRYGFNGQEKDNEVAGVGNINTAMFWEYDTRLGRRWNLDPVMNSSISTYITFEDNPIWKNDILGNSPNNYVFDERGTYVRTEKNNKPDKLVIENSKSSNRQSYDFADPVNDPKQIREGKINKVVFVSQAKVENILEENGAFEIKNMLPFSFFLNSTGGKKYDYSFHVIPRVFKAEGASDNPLDQSKPSPMLFLVEGETMAHNHMNFGNYLWAATGFSTGHMYNVLSAGAHFNSLAFPSKNGYSRQLDTEDDQRSIREGSNNSMRNNYQLMWLKKFLDKYGPSHK